MTIQIPEPIARALARVPAELALGVIELIGKIIQSPDPKAALARAAQVTAHEVASEAAVEAMFEAKAAVNRVAGTGE